MIYRSKYDSIEAFKVAGVNTTLDNAPDWVKEEWEEERLYIGEYGKEDKKGLFYSRGGKTAYRRYYLGDGSYLVKWSDGLITAVEKSVFEKIFEPGE